MIVKIAIKLFILFLFCFSTILFSQITGTVHDSDEIPINNVIVKLVENEKVVKYTFTDSHGNYVLKVPKAGNYQINISSLNYEEIHFPVEIPDLSSEYFYKFTLISSDFVELDEVIIAARRPIESRGDTIIYDAKHFSQGNELVLEDLLKKIPGIQVDSEGTIKVGDQEIEKIMIEGDDFFERGYKIISKNMPIHPIDKIELLQNYTDNKHLKGIDQSDRVALNLKFNEDAKSQWFGNIKVGLSDYENQRYQWQMNLMNFSKKNKYYFLNHFNNIGVDVAGEIEHLVNPSSRASDFIGDNFSTRGIVSLRPPQMLFKSERYNFNNAELVSLNSIHNLSDKVKIHPMLFLEWDEKDFLRNTEINYHLSNSESFTNNENYKLRNKKFNGFGKLSFSWDIKDNQTLETTTKFNKNTYSADSYILFNENSIIETLDDKPLRFDQELQFTHKFSNQEVLILQGRFIQEEFIQNYNSNTFLFNELFNDESLDSIHQKSENKGKLWGISAKYLNRKSNGNLLSLNLMNTYTQWDWANSLSENENSFSAINFNNHNENNTILNAKYLYKFSEKFYVHPGVTVGNTNNNFQTSENEISNNWLYLNAILSANWKPGRKNEFQFNYQRNKNMTNAIQAHSNYTISRYNSLLLGLSEPEMLDRESYFLNYMYGKFTDNFILNQSFFYIHNHDYISYESTVNQNYIIEKLIELKNKKTFNSNTTLDYYIRKLKTNVKFKVNYFSSRYENKVNNSDLRTIVSNNLQYGIEFRTAFRGNFNFHLGSEFSNVSLKTNELKNHYINNFSFFSVYLNLNKKWDLQANFEYYNTERFNEKKSYNFLDIVSKYQFNEKLYLSVFGRNLFNTHYFTNQSISDINIATTTYQLIPRYVMLSVEYKF